MFKVGAKSLPGAEAGMQINRYVQVVGGSCSVLWHATPPSVRVRTQWFELVADESTIS